MPTRQGDLSGSGRATSLAPTAAVLLGTATIAFCHGPPARGHRERQGGVCRSRWQPGCGTGCSGWLLWVLLPLCLPAMARLGAARWPPRTRHPGSSPCQSTVVAIPVPAAEGGPTTPMLLVYPPAPFILSKKTRLNRRVLGWLLGGHPWLPAQDRCHSAGPSAGGADPGVPRGGGPLQAATGCCASPPLPAPGSGPRRSRPFINPGGTAPRPIPALLLARGDQASPNQRGVLQERGGQS